MYNHGWWLQQDYVGTPSVYASGGTTSTSAIVRLVPAVGFAVVVLANGGSQVEWIADLAVDEFIPAIRDRRKTWTAPGGAPRQPQPISAELTGTWVGAIDTYRGRRPLTLSIDAAGKVTGSLAGVTAEVTLVNAGASGPRIFGLLPNADLGIEESQRGSYDVQLRLAMYGTRLAGYASTRAHANTVSNPVAFLVELTRK
jgi:hypothetical protein